MRLLTEATDQELEDYAKGKLKLVTNRKGLTRLEPVLKAHPNDHGITPPERRAYYRVWYMKNKDKRRAYSVAYKARQLAKAEAQPARELSRKEKDKLYMRGWRKRNKKYCQKYAHDKYLLRKAKLAPQRTPLMRLLHWLIDG
jgi:hypothetical protein